MNSNLPDVLTSLTVDAFAVLLGSNMPATASTTIQGVLSSFLQRKAREAHSILLEEISRGHRLSGDVDSDGFAGLLFRYLTATRHGAARLNLRLMAQLIVGTLQVGPSFKADELAHYSNILSPLTRNEVQLIATMWRLHGKVANRTDLSEEDKAIAIHNGSIELLVPKVFPTKDEYDSVAIATARTGLILVRSVWDGSRYDLGPLVANIVKLCSFESAFAKEPY